MILPKYPAEVTRNSALMRNLPTEPRSPDTYRQVLMQLPLTDNRYLPDEYGTKCNFYVRDSVLLMGYVFDHTVANNMIKDLDRGRYSGWQRMCVEDAAKNANMGCPTIAGLEAPGHGHVVMVLPQPDPDVLVTEPSALLISQAGRRNLWAARMALSWPVKALTLVKYYGAP